jgi:hypothetical protein
MSKRLTDEQRARIVEVYQAGSTLLQTAAAVGVSNGAVHRVLKDRDVARRPSGTPKRPSTVPTWDDVRVGGSGDDEATA